MILRESGSGGLGGAGSGGAGMTGGPWPTVCNSDSAHTNRHSAMHWETAKLLPSVHLGTTHWRRHSWSSHGVVLAPNVGAAKVNTARATIEPIARIAQPGAVTRTW